MNVENLTILANYLDTIPQDQFNMETYASVDDDKDVPLRAHDCKTAGCAVGWAPSAGIAISEDDSCWTTYSERVFGMGASSTDWQWCFGGPWQWKDNTPTGAARRIRYLLEHGTPENAMKQMWGHHQYVFANEVPE